GMAHLDKERHRQGLPPLPFGAALHLGEMLWGNIGAADRLDFTAIGPAVNLVSRLEGLCRPLGKAVLVSGAVAAETETPLIGLRTRPAVSSPCTRIAGGHGLEPAPAVVGGLRSLRRVVAAVLAAVSVDRNVDNAIRHARWRRLFAGGAFSASVLDLTGKGKAG